jgi:hypothetical protein
MRLKIPNLQMLFGSTLGLNYYKQKCRQIYSTPKFTQQKKFSFLIVVICMYPKNDEFQNSEYAVLFLDTFLREITNFQ